MNAFTHDGFDLAYIDHGEGPPVLLIHGFASTAFVNWVSPGWIKTLTGAGFRAIAFDHRRRADALQRPIVNAPGNQLLAAVLPQQLAALLVKAQQHAQVDRGWIASQVARPVVGTDVDAVIGNHRIAVGLAAQARDPANVF